VRCVDADAARPEAQTARRGVPLVVALGRATLALVPGLWLTAFLTRPIWIDAPLVDGFPGHPLATTFVVLALTIGFVSPWLLLPFGTMARSTIDPAGVLTVVTVLGRRRVDLERLRRVGALTMRGRTGDQFILYLRSERFRWALVSLGANSHLPGCLRERIEPAVEERPTVVSARARAMLRMGLRPGFAHRIALGSFTLVGGLAAIGAWTLFATALILMGCFPMN
jgi:hypothetical protein